MTHLVAKNWESFQHYSDRRPPWVKLYVALLDDFDYIAMSGDGKAALVAFWLSCARYGHPLPNNPRFLAERAGIRPAHLRELIANGWVIEVAKDASNDASVGASNLASTDASNPDSTHARGRASAPASARSREEEKEVEIDTSSSAAHAQRFVGAALEAYLHFRSRHSNGETFDGAVLSLAEPPSGNGAGWEATGTALADMLANDVDWNIALARKYCVRARRPAAATPFQKPRRAGRDKEREKSKLHALAAATSEGGVP